jgi:hypothetical protein
MGLGLISSKTMSEALSFRPLSVLGYDIDNNMLGDHGWSHVRFLAQKTSDDRMLEKFKRRVGQMEKAHKMRMKPRVFENDPAVEDMDEEEELTPDFMQRYTRLKWECLRTVVSLAVLQHPFPKPILYKQLKENLSLYQIVFALSRQKTRHLKNHGKQEPLCAISLDEYPIMTNAQ